MILRLKFARTATRSTQDNKKFLTQKDVLKDSKNVTVKNNCFCNKVYRRGLVSCKTSFLIITLFVNYNCLKDNSVWQTFNIDIMTIFKTWLSSRSKNAKIYLMKERKILAILPVSIGGRLTTNSIIDGFRQNNYKVTVYDELSFKQL